MGKIEKVTREEGGGVLLSMATEMAPTLSAGDSVAVDGVCLTVIAKDDSAWQARLMQETLNKTNLGRLGPDDFVNLERPLRGDQTLDGHFVQGHVDAVCEITNIQNTGDDKIFTFQPPKHIMSYLIPKGSVALNGVSLTVVDVTSDRFTVSMMPYTLNHTTFGKAEQGDQINIEADMIGKYIVSFLQKMPARHDSA